MYKQMVLPRAMLNTRSTRSSSSEIDKGKNISGLIMGVSVTSREEHQLDLYHYIRTNSVTCTLKHTNVHWLAIITQMVGGNHPVV